MRESAATGAEVTLKRLRAEIIAIERTGAGPLEAPTRRTEGREAGDESNAAHVGGGTQGHLATNAALLG